MSNISLIELVQASHFQFAIRNSQLRQLLGACTYQNNCQFAIRIFFLQLRIVLVGALTPRLGN